MHVNVCVCVRVCMCVCVREREKACGYVLGERGRQCKREWRSEEIVKKKQKEQKKVRRENE